MNPVEQHRYLVALPRGDRKVFLSWRLLVGDTPDAPFHVERRNNEEWERVNSESIVDSMNYLDSAPDGVFYEYRVVADDGAPSEVVSVDAGAEASMLALDWPLDPEFQVEGMVLGDLCNDGRMGMVLRCIRGNTVWICAHRHDGKVLWEFDTRLPARGGWDGSTQHVPLLCWDVNGDGRTETVFHSFKGDYPNEEYGTGVAGELLTALDSETGELVWETNWPAVQSRVMMTVGHLQGRNRPASVVVLDETYGDVVLTAVDGKTSEVFWRVEQARPAGHNLDIGDIDGDGVQEVICGGICYNGDGSLRWEAEPFGHTDISKPAWIDPEGEGMQIWYAVESNNPGVYLVDKEGKTLFKESFHHAHYGWVARHAPGVPGLHPHTAEDGRRELRDHFPIFLPGGSTWLDLSDWQRKNFVPVHWNEGREVSFIIRKENKRVVRLLESGEIEELPEGKLPEGGTYERNLGCMDVIGDYRENIVTVDTERNRLMVLVNPAIAGSRGYSPNDHFEYRHDRSQLGSGYYIYLSPPDTIV